MNGFKVFKVKFTQNGYKLEIPRLDARDLVSDLGNCAPPVTSCL